MSGERTVPGRVLVLGAGGMLGRDVVAEAPEGVAVAAHSRADTDITTRDQVERAIREERPDVIINCAAYTAVDRAESEPELAHAVNATGPGLLGAAAASIGAPHSVLRVPCVLHFSTDYVFDGTAAVPYREHDPVSPLGVYGRTKLAGERALEASGAPHLIIRTSWLFGRHGRSFPRTMWERAQAGRETRVVNDQTGRPTYTVDLARTTWKLLGTAVPPRRRLHAVNSGTATWHDVARRVFTAAGCADLLSPCTTAEYPTPAARPAWSVLDTTTLEAVAGPMPPWEDAVDRFLRELRSEGP